MTSTDGYTWAITSVSSTNSWRSVCWSPELGLFCAVSDTGNGDRVMTSTDGINWIYRTTPADNEWDSVCWSSQLSLFCAVSDTGSSNRIMFSFDGITWSLAQTSVNNDWKSVCWAPELAIFCSVASTGTNNRVMTSTPIMPIAQNITMTMPSYMVVTATRNVGMGTVLPQNVLHVVGSTYIASNVGIGTTLPTTSSTTLSVLNNASASTGVGIGTTLVTALLTLPAGTTSLPSILITPDTDISTAVAGAIEYNGTAFTMSIANNARSVTMNEQMAVQETDYLLTNSTTYQKLLDVSTNGAVSVPAGTSLFECSFTLSNLNTSSATFGFGLNTTSASTQGWSARTTKSSTLSGNNFKLGHYTTSNASLFTANTDTYCIGHIRGIIKMDSTGTVTPQVSISAANTNAYVVKGSYFRIQTIHSANNANITIGNWS